MNSDILVAVIGAVFGLAYAIFVGVIIWRSVKNERGQAEQLLKYYEEKDKENKEKVENAKKKNNDFSESLEDDKENENE